MRKKISIKKTPARKSYGKIANLPGEQWKKMNKADRPYMVSNLGRIKSFYFDSANGSLVKGKNVNGYLAMDLVYKGERKMHYVHCLIAEHFLKRPSFKKAVVIHIDWNKLNNKTSNLQWSKPREAFIRTAEQNKKLAAGGKRFTLASKLSKDQVVKIKQSLKKGILQNQLARKYKISEMQISRIARGESWGYIKV